MIAKRRMTRAEYDERTERGEFEGQRFELIFGEIVPMSPQSDRHVELVRWLNQHWNRVLLDHTVQCQVPVNLPLESKPEPDFSILPGGSARLLRGTWNDALVVIEVSIETLRNDRTSKKRLYATSNIPEYWIVNGIDNQIEIHRQPEGEDYRETFIVRPGERVAFAFLPSLSFSVAELLLVPEGGKQP